MDLINQLVQILRKELVQLRDSVQELNKKTGLDLVKLQNEGQLSYIVKLNIYISLEYRNISTQYT